MPMQTWWTSKGLTLAASQACTITCCRLRLATSSPTRAALQLSPVAWPSSSAPLLMAQSVLVPPASIPRYNGMYSHLPTKFAFALQHFCRSGSVSTKLTRYRVSASSFPALPETCLQADVSEANQQTFIAMAMNPGLHQIDP